MIQTTLYKLCISLSILFTSIVSAQIVTETSLWESKQIDDVYLLKIKSNVDLLEALNDFSTTKDINHAIVQGSGAVLNVVLSNDANTKLKKMKSNINLTSLTGSLTLIDGIRTWDIKGTLSSNNLKAFTGTIKDAKVNDRVELYVYEIDQKVHRTTDNLQTKAVFDFTK